MKIAIGSDHAGFELKQRIIEMLSEQGIEYVDVGTYDTKSVDYPDYAEKVSLSVKDKKADRGIMICGSGVGACIACNKVPEVRAAICHDTYSAHQGVEHDDMNVLVLGSRIIGIELAYEIIHNFLQAKLRDEERFIRRLNKVKSMETRYASFSQKNR